MAEKEEKIRDRPPIGLLRETDISAGEMVMLAVAGSISVGTHQFGRGVLPCRQHDPWPKPAQEPGLVSKGKLRKDRKPYS